MESLITWQTEATYPQPVDAEQFGVLTRLRARLDRATLGENLFLGYCKDHRTYFVDHNHTNDVIRCPICDEEWLTQHNKSSIEANVLLVAGVSNRVKVLAP